MTVERNVDGLRDNAQRKRQETFEKVEQGIQQLIKEKQAINFNTVAKASGVSKAWLYKEPEIKARIEHLRQNHSKPQKLLSNQKTSDGSKDAIIKNLKATIQKVEAINSGLKEHLEAIHGRQRVLADENEALRRENEQLTKFLAEAKAEIKIIKSESNKLALPSSLASSIKGKAAPLARKKSTNSDIFDAIKSELENLPIENNSTLKKLIESAPKELIFQGIGTLKEALSKGEVRNPTGFLVAAIKNSWMPNQDCESKKEQSLFNEWYPLAKSLKLVSAATSIKGVQHILTIDDDWIPFSELVKQYPLETLIEMAKQQ